MNVIRSAQQTLRLIDKSWKGTFKGIKEYKKNPGKFSGKVKLPKYKPKDGEAILIFTNQQCEIKDGNLVFPKNLNLSQIKIRLPNNTNLREVRIIPKGTGYTCEIVYKTISEEGEINRRWYSRRINENRITGIDLGLRNIVTIGNNIGTIVIGHNDNWKQEAELGKKNNQNFVSIPYYKLIQMLQYKAEEAGIAVKEQEESHTSKCSFLDNEPIEHHDKYMGKRIKRGIFRSAKGILINADVQGALNIIRKAFPKAFPQGSADGIEGVGLHPERANIKMILSFEEVC